MQMKAVWVLCTVVLLMSGCQSRKSGEQLAQQYCGSCHLFTEPSLLDKTTWKKSVLPEMAFRMGLMEFATQQKGFDELADAYKNVPATPLLTKEEFLEIVKYYETNAPDSLPNANHLITDSLTGFSVRPIQSAEMFPMVCLTMTDSLHRIFIGDRRKKLLQLDDQLKVVDQFNLNSPPSCVRTVGEKLWCAEMGMMDPNDKAIGEIVELDLNTRNSKVVVDSLKRPVYFERADLNQDGRKDIVVCEFGNYSGMLSVFELQASGKYRKHIVEASPGARKVIVGDYNGDGLPDLMALFSQGNERIELLVNQGDFQFKPETLVRFPAVYGVSYFEVQDFNHDGKFDFLVTNGDNSDYSQILKPYHGVRILLNDGHQQFNESWFYPMYGASWAEAKDFDQDGDLDISAISFFPDFSFSQINSFIYFENQNGKMIPKVTKHIDKGRWLVMETTDVDRDGDVDILLGALDFNPGQEKLFRQWKDSPVSLLLLENKLRPHK